MDANVIDTLKFANRLKESGFESPKAEGLARALGEELGDRVLTSVDRDAFGVRFDELATRSVGLDVKFDARFEGLEAKFDARFEGLEAKFDARFEGLEAKFEGLEAKFEGLEAKFGGLAGQFKALETKLDVQYESVKVQLASTATNFKLLVTMFAVGFSAIIGLGVYDVMT